MPNPKDTIWAEAKAKGEATYFTGKPCRNGHVAPRKTSGRNCIECNKVNRRNRLDREVQQNRIAGKRQQGIRLAAIERGEDRYFTGRPCVNGHVDWRAVNSKVCLTCSRESTRKARLNPKVRERDVFIATQRNRRIRKATPTWVDKQNLWAIYSARPEGYHVDHIVPINHELVCGLHVPANLQYLSADDNLRKTNKFEPLFISAN